MKKYSRKKPVVGKYALDSMSIGMYNHPLMVLREYVQNSVDSIDEFYNKSPLKECELKIDIKINGSDRNITIRDNGGGVSSNKAWSILCNIGESTKSIYINRGFRGIGRLGGVAYCDKLKFVTKARGEDIVSVVTWDCNKLRNIIKSNAKLGILAVIKKVANLSQEKYKGLKKDHFFIVEMENLKSSNNVLLDFPEIKSYLAQVAPVPFDPLNFSFSTIIESNLKDKNIFYKSYNIYINGEQIFKPYKDIVRIGSKIEDKIQGIDFYEFGADGETLAFGWIARLKFLGVISSSSCIDGIRLRSGNILVGDKDLLSDYYREKRFNNYMVGELYTASGKLVLNSRRDDFEDNLHKENFYNYFIKIIGLPFSRKIREVSQLRSRNRAHLRKNNLINEAKSIRKHGHLSIFQRKKVTSELNRLKKTTSQDKDKREISHLIDSLKSTRHFLEINHKSIPSTVKRTISPVFDIIYKNCKDKNEARYLISMVIKQIGK